jgi:putative flippase GtrA
MRASDLGRTTRWLRFLVAGVASVGVDSATLVALRELTTTPLWLATTAAFTVSLAVNFSLNMRWVFAAQGRLGGRLARYGGLVVVNYLLTLALVLGLAAAGVHYLIARWLAIAAAAVVNYVAYRHWVFR